MTTEHYQFILRNIERSRLLLKLFANYQDVLPLIQTIMGDTLYMEDDLNIIETRRILRKIFQVNESLVRYYAHGPDSLAVTYSYGDVKVIFYTSDVEEWLQKISRGTCQFMRVEETLQSARIVCNRAS